MDYLPFVSSDTIFIRANVVFAKFGLESTNAVGTTTTKGLNLFTLADIVTGAHMSMDTVVTQGAIILVSVHYACDLNKQQSPTECQPDFRFYRMDAAGFQYSRTEVLSTAPLKRRLQTVTGVRLYFVLSGKAGRFSLPITLLAIGSGMGLLAVAAVVTDLIMLHCVCCDTDGKLKQIFTDARYDDVTDNEDTLTFEEVDESFR